LREGLPEGQHGSADPRHPAGNAEGGPQAALYFLPKHD
jgi:hypothetical protein